MQLQQNGITLMGEVFVLEAAQPNWQAVLPDGRPNPQYPWQLGSCPQFRPPFAAGGMVIVQALISRPLRMRLNTQAAQFMVTGGQPLQQQTYETTVSTGYVWIVGWFAPGAQSYLPSLEDISGQAQQMMNHAGNQMYGQPQSQYAPPQQQPYQQTPVYQYQNPQQPAYQPAAQQPMYQPQQPVQQQAPQQPQVNAPVAQQPPVQQPAAVQPAAPAAAQVPGLQGMGSLFNVQPPNP